MAFVTAEIQGFDVTASQDKLLKLSNKYSSVLSSVELEKELHHLYSDNLRIIFLINNWLTRAKADLEHLTENKLFSEINGLIKAEYKFHLKDLIEFSNCFDSSPLLEKMERIKALDPAWGTSSIYQELKEKDLNQVEAQNAYRSYTRIYRAFVALLSHLKEFSANYLNEVLTNYPYHDAHISLLLSFLKSLKYVRNDLNNLLERHLNYYYFEILKQQKRNAKPDYAYLSFQLFDHLKTLQLKAGERLTSDVDENGSENLYRLMHDLDLNNTQIIDIRTIHLANNNQIGIGKLYKDVSNVYASRSHLDSQGFLIDSEGLEKPRFLFGRDQSVLHYSDMDMKQTKIGFSVSSSILSLSEGERVIDFTLKCQLKSLTSLISFVEEVSGEEKVSPDHAMQKILGNIFCINFTSKDGWYRVKQYEVSRKNAWIDGELNIKLKLDFSEPSIVNFNPEIHGSAYSSKWPIIEFLIDSSQAMFSYSYIKDLKLESCLIDVSVKKIRNLSLFNDTGMLDINAPFYPFGTTPDIGSYFLIGSEELFRKSLNKLSLEIEWHNLPRGSKGLAGYYHSYEENINNHSFKIKIKSLSDFQFIPNDIEIAQEFNLFQSEGKSKRLQGKTVLENLDLKLMKFKPSFERIPTDSFSSESKTGFLKFELTGPEIGFGVKTYSKKFSEVAMKNASSSASLLGQKQNQTYAFPNEPFAPQISSISLNYHATQVLNFNSDSVELNSKEANDQFYHVHPFGNELIFDKGIPLKKNLVSQYNSEGYLYLGFDKIHFPTTLSIYFELEDHNWSSKIQLKKPKITWSYLLNNQWYQLEDTQVLSDTTNGFTNSGVIQLQLISQMNLTNDILPSQLYWLCAEANENTALIPKFKFIAVNGAKVKWEGNENNRQWKKSIPPFTIDGWEKHKPEIKAILQPFESFDGLKAESTNDFYFRVSERIRHKNRAILPIDFERIILAEFPEIYQVLCLTNSMEPDFVNVGQIILVLVPKINKDRFSLPRVPIGQIAKVKNLFNEIKSPFSKLSVVNPVYHTVRVICTVKFELDSDSGASIKRLRDDLRGFICPWFYNQNQGEMDFGGSIQRSEVFSFIESLPYINFLTGLSIVVKHLDNEGAYRISDTASSEGLNLITAGLPWAVLVPDESHEISVTSKGVHTDPQLTSIQSMELGSYFVIDEEAEKEVIEPRFSADKDTFYSIEIKV